MREQLSEECAGRRRRGRRGVAPAVLLAGLLAMAGASASSAQLDSSCMVSALNRTAPVAGDGSWVLPNVPANLGMVRVRATCVRGGALQFGNSSLVAVPANGVLTVADIVFTAPVPVPLSLALSAPATTLSGAGQTVQLAAQATYADGTTADVIDAASGIDFRTSNPAIATVDSGGLVTAHASGNVFVSATVEGTLGVVAIQVVLSGSSVNDGIPDDWKIAHGLDPNDPAVAFEDPDQDGLTNLEEYQNGTDPHNPDTDGDGLSDGDEVHVYHTNPLLWDSDGDGISDGVEVQTGSNPLDIHSFNLAAALSSITASPASFRLIYNTVDGQSSRQLQAVGNVIDGRTIDMFNPLYQTQVSSSDLTVANFGVDLGRVYAGQSGSATITVSTSGHAATASVAVQTFSPTALAFLPLYGFLNAVDVAGDYAYVAAGANGLYVIDVSNLAAPFLAAFFYRQGNANDVRVAGTIAYMADGDRLLTVDVSDPLHPALLGQAPIAGNAVRLAVGGGLAVIADETYGLRVVDVGNPMQPREIGSLPLAGTPRAVSLDGSQAVVACGDSGVSVVDLSDPTAPVLLGTTPAGAVEGGGIVARGHLAYVAAGLPLGFYGGLHVLELSVPATPVEVGATQDNLGISRIAVEDHFALGPQFFAVDQVPIFDIGALPPVFSAVLDLSTVQGATAARGSDIALRQGAVFETANPMLGDFGSTGANGGLYTALYRLPVDAGTSPPTVAITAPAPGITVRERVPLTFSAVAQDEVLLTSVSFLVDGAVVDTIYKAPYQTTFAVPSGQTSLDLQVVATSISGAQATAQETLAVQPNPLPVVRLLAPVAGETRVPFQTLWIAAQATDDQAVTKVEIYGNGQLIASTTSASPVVVYTVQGGSPTLAVTAIAYDDGGPGEPAGPVLVNVVPDQPPSVGLFSPVDGAQVIEGTSFAAVAGATSAVGISSVQLFQNGSETAFALSPPYEFSVAAPPAGQSLQLHVLAYDSVGTTAATSDITVFGVADPGTTVVGTVLDPDAAPVAAAMVTVDAGGNALTAVTANDGTYTVSGVAAGQGDLSVSASGTVGGCPATGSVAVTPVPSGTTNAGAIFLSTGAQTTTVTGIVLGPDGQGLAGAAVQLSSADTADLATVVSGAGGVFAVAGFPARFWAIGAEATATVGGVHVAGATNGGSFAVAGGTTTLGTLQLQPLAVSGPDPLTTVTGTVVNGDGSPAAGAQIVVDLGYLQLVTAAGADGSFTLSGVPTLQGGLSVAASIRQACAVYDSGQPQSFNQLNAGGVTDVGQLFLRPDRGPIRD